MLRPARFSLPSRIATDGERIRPCLEPAIVPAVFDSVARHLRRAAADDHSRIVGPLVLARRICCRTGQDRRLSWGLVPFSVFRRRCAGSDVPHPNDPTSTFGGREADRCETDSSAFIESATSLWFFAWPMEPDERELVSSPHRLSISKASIGRPPRRDIRRHVPRCWPAYQSRDRGKSAPLGVPSLADPALMGFHPSQLFSGRTVPSAFARRMPTCRLRRPNHPD